MNVIQNVLCDNPHKILRGFEQKLKNIKKLFFPLLVFRFLIL